MNLEGLHAIVLPAPVSWLPQTIGWYAVLTLLLGLGTWIGYRIRRRHRANRYRGLALVRLDEIERLLATGDRVAALAELPELVKRTALEAYPRAQVASLSGDEWLSFLDRSYDGTSFTDGPGRLLPKLAYDPPAETGRPDSDEIRGLTNLLRRWIRHHESRPVIHIEEGAAGAA